MAASFCPSLPQHFKPTPISRYPKFPSLLKAFLLKPPQASQDFTVALVVVLGSARIFSGNLGMIALRNAYHGGSAGTIGLTALNTWKYPIRQGEIHHVVNPNPYRGVFGSDSSLYAQDVQDHIDHGTSGRVAGFISETIQGVGGAVELAPGYLKRVYEMVRKAGGVCIADEVQTGFGRTEVITGVFKHRMSFLILSPWQRESEMDYPKGQWLQLLK